MAVRFAKVAAALLMGLALICQGLPAFGMVAAPEQQAAMSCCAKGCTRCGAAACCASSSENRAPTPPVRPSPSSQELQAIAPAIRVLLAFEPPTAFDFFLPAASAALQDGTVPIFQRNCSFLI